MDKHLNCNFTNLSKADISKKLYDGLISNDIEYLNNYTMYKVAYNLYKYEL